MLFALSAPPAIEILQRAERVWHEQRLPPYVEFTTHFINQRDPVRVIIRTYDGAVYARTEPLDPDQNAIAYPGVHITGPDGAALGFCVSEAYCSGVLASDPFAVQPVLNPAGLKTIIELHAHASPYEAKLLGTIRYNGHDVYDLALTPLVDPARYQLRELLVDAQSYQIWQMTYDVPIPYAVNDATITYQFGPLGEDVWYLQYICVEGAVREPGGPMACKPESTDLRDFEFPTSEPRSDFDSPP